MAIGSWLYLYLVALPQSEKIQRVSILLMGLVGVWEITCEHMSMDEHEPMNKETRLLAASSKIHGDRLMGWLILSWHYHRQKKIQRVSVRGNFYMNTWACISVNRMFHVHRDTHLKLLWRIVTKGFSRCSCSRVHPVAWESYPSNLYFSDNRCSDMAIFWELEYDTSI